MKILKPNEIGYGGLIENDAGFIDPTIDLNKTITEGFTIEQEQDIILYAVLQKADTENKNKRVYPYDILKKEVERYKKTINLKTALNELNHPECVPGDVEILTENGWKLIKDLLEDENILTLNQENNKIEIKKINKYIKQKYTGDMISIKGRNIDILTTPNHRFWVINSNNGEGKFITAEEILNSDNLSNYYIPKLENEKINLDVKDIEVKKVNYDDYVYCVNVPNHIFYVRSNNKAHWTGNSSIISLDKVSHQILDIWMEGKVVWGKLKILTSPGFKKYGYVGNYAPDIAANLLLHGINIGISSRGVGSVKKQGGVNIVQNDFELICFDLVHSPSTPGAYLMQDKAMERQFNESEEKKNNLLIDKLDKFII